MFPQDIKTWIFYILLALTLGALGSGLWEILFKPTILKTRQIALKIVTFGMTSTRDSIYKEIAARPIQKPSFLILTLIIMALAAALGFSSAHFKKVHFDDNQTAITESTTADSTTHTHDENLKAPLTESEIKSIENNIKNLKKEIHELQKNISSLLLFLILMVFSFTISSFTKCKYIHSAICHFDQLFCICLPYIDTKEERIILSEFAQIKSKNDYYNLIEKLQKIANSNNISSTPKFTLF